MKVVIDKVGDSNFRIAVIDGNGILQDLHYNTTVDQLRGRLYLGYITRIESSLQAAFVDYGGNKNGFLPLSEVSLDDYNIPNSEKNIIYEKEENETKDNESKNENDDNDEDNNDTNDAFDVGSLTQINESQIRNFKFYRKYRIQDVLEVGQIVLVQVVKEERGNKGVTLSTYINLTGRFCLLLPNTRQRSKISNKIEDENERNRLRDIIKKLSLNLEMSVVIRSSGNEKSFNDIKSDFIQLTKIWHNIKVDFEKQLALLKDKYSQQYKVSPKLIFNNNEIISDFIRDYWSDDYHTIVVAEKELYSYVTKVARETLKKTAPKISLLNNSIPIFTYFNIERQIAELYQNTVQLASGGHIVINKTEALVAIDVNSGRMTSERDVEDTAFSINSEAISIIVRQIRLRELSGILILDFIDMMESNNRKIIEQKLYAEFRKYDNAKIKISRISPLGLVEMSRQRLRSSFQEIFTTPCYLCSGRGIVRNIYETGFAIIRAIETDFFVNEFTIHKNNKIKCTVHTNNNIAIHLLNEARNNIIEIEKKLNIKIKIAIDNKMYQDMFNIHFIDENEREQGVQYIRNGQLYTKQLPSVENNQNDNSDKKSDESMFSHIIKKWINKIVNN